MCLAIYKPASVSIDVTYLQNGFENNSHGAGFAVRQDDNTVLICKGFFKFDTFLAAYLLHSSNQERQAIIHFRWATHGKTNAFNCHPWPMGEPTIIEVPGVPLAMVAPAAMIHNGVLSHRSDTDRSDTGYYVLDILDPLYRKYPGFVGDEVVAHLIAEDIGSYNKFVLMNGDGAYSIVNHKAGTIDEGSWYSNCDFRASRSFGRGAWSYADDEDWPRGAWQGRSSKSLAAEAAPETVEPVELIAGPSESTVEFFPGQELMPHEQEEVTRLCLLFPEAAAEFEDAEELLAFFRGARASYRRMNAEAQKLSQAEVDTLMQTESYVESLLASGVVFRT